MNRESTEGKSRGASSAVKTQIGRRAGEAKNKSIDDQNRTNYRGRGNFQGRGGSGEDENKVEDVDSPPKTMKKQSKN